MYITIQSLMERGLNKSQISRITKHDWKTVSKIVEKIKSGETAPIQKPHPSILDSKKGEVLELIEKGLTAVRIHEEMLLAGVKISYSAVKSYCSGLKKKHDIFVRIHTDPGEEAQVDFGYVGITRDNHGRNRKTWVFNMRLSYSREDYFLKVYNQKVETFIECHVKAFKYFGGIPKYVKIDNLKAAILEANFYEPVYQHLYKSFADYYGFNPLPCRIYSPNDKGKVESGIKYVKRNFFSGRTFKNGDELDRRLQDWLDRTCNRRIHGTTRKIPAEVFEKEEQPVLKKLPLENFKILKVGERKVYHDCHIFVDYNYYSVPFEYVGKKVSVELSDKFLKVYYDNKRVAMHNKIANDKGCFRTEESHYPRYKRFSDTEYQEKYLDKMSSIGKYARQLFFFIKAKCPNYWYRPIQGILSLLKSYPKEVVNLSCKRGLAFGVYQYQIIKKICFNGSYILPLEFFGGNYANAQK